jgi:alpha-aminoadipate carrier protein LysW
MTLIRGKEGVDYEVCYPHDSLCALHDVISRGGIIMAECPVCGVELKLAEGTEKGEIIACHDCGSELEVTGKDSVAEAPQEEEDWGE